MAPKEIALRGSKLQNITKKLFQYPNYLITKVQRLGLPDELKRSLRSTNILESANNGVRDRSRNVKRWRDGAQVERWTAAGLLETEKKFRRIKGYRHMPLLIAALNSHTTHEQQAA